MSATFTLALLSAAPGAQVQAPAAPSVDRQQLLKDLQVLSADDIHVVVAGGQRLPDGILSTCTSDDFTFWFLATF